MPTQHDMTADSEIYRAILEYEFQPTKWEQNPHYDPNFTVTHHPMTSEEREKKPWLSTINIPDGPKVTKSHMIGPYQTVGPIKAYVTRHRSRYENLRIKSIQRVTVWEDVEV